MMVILIHLFIELLSIDDLLDYFDVFMSCLDSHFDGTRSLQMIHWWASAANVMLNVSKYISMKK